MNKSAVAAMVLLLGLAGFAPARAEQRARSWEISPWAGVMNGSAQLGGDVQPLGGVRLGYNINRWWEVELGYSFIPTVDYRSTVGRSLEGGQDDFGRGVWLEQSISGFSEGDGQLIDFNVLLSSPPVKRRWTFYGTVGLGQGLFQGAMTQAQIDEAFTAGPNPVPDAFDYNGNGSQTDLVDQYACTTCDIVFTPPPDPVPPTWIEPDPSCPDPADLTCYDASNPAPARSFVASGRDLDQNSSAQWNVGAGARLQLTDLMALRLDLRNVNGLGESYNAQIFSAGLSFRFGGEPAIDDDGDGVPSYRDACPDTPTGATVDERGCPSDGDGDEVLDGLDKCPNTPAGWPVDGEGCPTDGDGDGVPDGRDTCADTPAGAVVDYEGCPVDSDGDGVFDGLDACMTTPVGAVVDDKGCAVDSDGDGVPDGIDQCDDTEAGLPVDAAGCPIDSDGDGLKDDVDECRDFAGPGGVDDKGCPRFRLDTTVRVPLPAVTFAFGSAVLTDQAKEDLGALVAALNYYSDLTVEVEGHTDDIGSERENFLISVDRARSVKRFLTDQGIDPARVTVRGYGEIRPIADNASEEGRRQNRRIEVLVTGTVQADEPSADSTAHGGA